MLQRELKPDTDYATCDGRMVVTDKEVTGGWFQYTYTDDKGEHARIDQQDPRKGLPDGVEPGKADPWATCSVGVRPQMLRIYARGIRVLEFDYDRDGNKINAGTWIVLPAKDIAGTWSDYRLLHADRIVMRDEVKQVGQRVRERSAELNERLTRLFGPRKQVGRVRSSWFATVRVDYKMKHDNGVISTASYAPGPLSTAQLVSIDLVEEISFNGTTVDAVLDKIDPPKPIRKRAATKRAASPKVVRPRHWYDLKNNNIQKTYCGAPREQKPLTLIRLTATNVNCPDCIAKMKRNKTGIHASKKAGK
jgi:hypothetical protein